MKTLLLSLTILVASALSVQADSVRNNTMLFPTRQHLDQALDSAGKGTNGGNLEMIMLSSCIVKNSANATRLDFSWAAVKVRINNGPKAGCVGWTPVENFERFNFKKESGKPIYTWTTEKDGSGYEGTKNAFNNKIPVFNYETKVDQRKSIKIKDKPAVVFKYEEQEPISIYADIEKNSNSEWGNLIAWLIVLAALICVIGILIRKADEKERRRWEAMSPAEREAETKKIEARQRKAQKEFDLQVAELLNKPVFKNTTPNDAKITYQIGNNYYLKIVKPGMLSIFPQGSKLIAFESP